MSVSTNENNLYLAITVSLLLHVAAFLIAINLPQTEKLQQEEPIMVDLESVPVLREKPSMPVKPREKSEARGKVSVQKRVSVIPQEKLMPLPSAAGEASHKEDTTPKKIESKPPKIFPEAKPVVKPPAEESEIGIFKPRKRQETDLAKLFPSARSQQKIESGYRKKYGDQIGGDTLFLEDEDNIMGSYSRRFVNAANDRLGPIANQLIRDGQIGYGLMLITINKNGSVEDIKVIESSGNRIVDSAYIRILKSTVYAGPLPKKWPYDKVHGYYIYSAGYIIK